MIEAFIAICLFGAIGLVVMEYRLGAQRAATSARPAPGPAQRR